MHQIKEKWQTIVLIALMTAAVVFTFFALIKPKYELESKLILIPGKFERDIKLVDYYTGNFSEIVLSEEFVSRLEGATAGSIFEGISRPEDIFRVFAKEDSNVLILKVSMYSPVDARNLSKLIIEQMSVELSNNNHKNAFKIKVLQSGTVVQSPSSGQVAAFSFLGFLAGLVIASILVVFFKKLEFDFLKTKEISYSWIGKKLKDQLEGRPTTYEEDEYVIEKKQQPEENEAEPEEEKPENYEKDFTEETGSVVPVGKTGAAPENLPIFLSQEGDREDEFVSPEELEDSPASLEETSQEPSEEEVKERLNKLLKGDL